MNILHVGDVGKIKKSVLFGDMPGAGSAFIQYKFSYLMQTVKFSSLGDVPGKESID